MNEAGINQSRASRILFKESLTSLKVRLTKEISRCVSRLGLSQRQLAQRSGLAQPDVSAITRGHYGGFSLDRLFQFLSLLGRQIVITIRKKPSGSSPAIAIKIPND